LLEEPPQAGTRLRGRSTELLLAVGSQCDERQALEDRDRTTHSTRERVDPSISETAQQRQVTTLQIHPKRIDAPQTDSVENEPPTPGILREFRRATKFAMGASIYNYLYHELRTVEVAEDFLLGKLLVIVGGARNAWCTTCGEYLGRQWPRVGPAVLGIFDKWYREATRENVSGIVPPGFLNFHFDWQLSKHSLGLDLFIIGLDDEIVLSEIAEVLNWLGCVFCRRDTSGLQESTLVPPERTSVGYRIKPPIFTDLSRDVWSCWHPLFPNKVIVAGLYFPQRPDTMNGLEIDLGLLAELAGIEFPVFEDRGVHLEGLYTMLYPMEISRGDSDCLQWHLYSASAEEMANEKSLASFKRAAMPKRWYRTDTLKELQKPHRHFLGWCESSIITLGTRDQSYSNVKSSSADIKESITADLATTLALGVNIHGVGPTISKSYQRLPAERNLFEGLKQNYDTRLLWAQKDQVLLYHWKRRQAWLVPKTSVLLHLIITSMHKMTSEDTTLSFEHPYTMPSYDGGRNAYATLMTHWNYQLAFTRPEPLWKFATRFLGAFDLLIRGSVKSLNRDILGWEFMDLVIPPTRSYCKFARLPISAMVGGWGKLLPDIPLVLFYDNIDDPILPLPHQTRAGLCQGRRMPCQEDFMGATVKSIQNFAERKEGDLLKYGQLSNTCFWHSPKPPFSRCRHVDKSFSDLLQFIRLYDKTPPSARELTEYPEAAVVFSPKPA
jgi:hypothetical protein